MCFLNGAIYVMSLKTWPSMNIIVKNLKSPNVYVESNIEPKRLQNSWHDVLLLFVQAEGLGLTLHRVISIRVTQWMIQRPPAWMHEMLCCFWFVVCSAFILFLFWLVCVQFMYLLWTVSINSDITCSCGPDYVTITTQTLHHPFDIPCPKDPSL